ncbi:MAG TPA: hypothetical protein VGS62_10150 [Streptosporangiaceae bacterium]|nr:hypothetical protein [Streptosporangiaceae bacterium]
MAGAAMGNRLLVAGRGVRDRRAVAGVAGRPIGRLGIVEINVDGLAGRLAAGRLEWLGVLPGGVAGVGEALTAGLVEDPADGDVDPEQAETATEARTATAPQPIAVNLAPGPVLAMVTRIVTDPPQAPVGGGPGSRSSTGPRHRRNTPATGCYPRPGGWPQKATSR